MKKVIALTFLLTFFIASSAIAKDVRHEDIMSKNLQAITEIENYLNNIKTYETSFIQSDTSGNMSEGHFYLSRPGKMRVEYTLPSDIIIHVNNELLIYYDVELDEIQHIKTESTPASFLTRENFSFNDKDVEIVDFQENENVYSITIRRTENPEMGEFTFVLKRNPLELKKLIVGSSVDDAIAVIFTDIKLNKPIKNSVFTFKDPRLP